MLLCLMPWSPEQAKRKKRSETLSGTEETPCFTVHCFSLRCTSGVQPHTAHRTGVCSIAAQPFARTWMEFLLSGFVTIFGPCDAGPLSVHLSHSVIAKPHSTQVSEMDWCRGYRHSREFARTPQDPWRPDQKESVNTSGRLSPKDP